MAFDWLRFLIVALLSLQSTCFLFDSEEIKSLNFVVDIQDQPVLLTETPDERTVQMYNRAGQAYSCLLPDTESLLQQYRQETETSQHASVPSLLAPMASGPCLQRTRNWWTYELCPMSEIRQYHMEGGQIVGKTSILGRFESDFDWSLDDGRSRNAKQRFHSQTYTNGSDCDLTGRPRSAEVRYLCEEGGDDALVRVDEPETCRYVLTVHTARVCGHRALAPPASRRPQPVTCRPALSETQMERLAGARRERERREAERAATRAELRENEGKHEEEMWGEQEEEEERVAANVGEIRSTYLEKAKHLFDEIAAQTKKQGEILDDVIHNYIRIVSDFDSDTDYDLERLEELRERHQVVRAHHEAHAERIRAFFDLAEAGDYHTDQIVMDLLAYTGTLTAFSEVMVGLSEETRRLKEFLRSHPSVTTDDTLGQLLRTMANLSSLSIQLFADTEAWQAELRSWQGDLTASLAGAGHRPGDRHQPQGGSASPPPGDRTSGDGPPRPAGGPAETATEATGGDVDEGGDAYEDVESSEVVSSAPDRPEDGPSSPAEDGQQSSEDSDGEDDRAEEEEEEEELTEEEEGSGGTSKKKHLKFSTLRSLGLDKMVQVSEIDPEQRARIERAVKRKLGNVGLDTNGPEIKVRFLKFPDLDHLNKEHTLTEEEMAAFENALVAVMMGGSEALVEHEKHSRQAKNYEYTFDQAVEKLETEPEGERDEPAAVDETLFRLV